MPISLNHIIIAGNLTRDPQVRTVVNANGERAVANFCIAANQRYKGSDGEQKESTVYIDCEAWGRTAEMVGQYLTQGRACIVDGKLKFETWTDKEGRKCSRHKIQADSVQFVPSGKSGHDDHVATDPAHADDADIASFPSCGVGPRSLAPRAPTRRGGSVPAMAQDEPPF